MVYLLFLFFCLVLDFTRIVFLIGPNFAAAPAALRCVACSLARSLAHLLCCCFVGYKKTPRSLLSVRVSVRPFVRPSIRRGLLLLLLLLVGLFCCEFVYFVLLLFSLQLFACRQVLARFFSHGTHSSIGKRHTETHREKE